MEPFSGSLDLYLGNPPYEPMKLSLDKLLIWKPCFLLAFTLAKMVSELNDIIYRVKHLKGWESSTFDFVLDFVAMTQNSSAFNPRFEEFTVPSLDDSVDGDIDKILLCSIRAIKKY